jgi:hypothetical protein
MKNVKYYFEFIYDYQSFLGRDVSIFFKDIVRDFIPVELFGEGPFNNHSYTLIEEEDFKFRAISVYGKNKDIINICSAVQNRLIPRRFSTTIRFIPKSVQLCEKELVYLFCIGVFHIGFETNIKYYNSQSDDNPQSYYPNNNFHVPLPDNELKKFALPLYFNENIQLYRIDISQNPGRERFLPGMKFIPAYKIWYGKEAQTLFGRKKILQYPNAIYVKELDNGVIEMQLMDDITKCHLPYNQEKQIDIVKYLGVDKIEVSKY